VFKEIMLNVYRNKLAGPAPEFPPEMEQSISNYLNSGPVETAAVAGASVAGMFESGGLNVQAANAPARFSLHRWSLLTSFTGTGRLKLR
jgi:hypothetical protein